MPQAILGLSPWVGGTAMTWNYERRGCITCTREHEGVPLPPCLAHWVQESRSFSSCFMTLKCESAVETTYALSERDGGRGRKRKKARG